MNHPLDVKRAQLLRMIKRLEQLYHGLRDNGTRVSDEWAAELKQLQVDVQNTDSSTRLKFFFDVAEELLKVAAAEVVKRILETLNCLTTVLGARSSAYDGRRSNQILTVSCGLDAA